MNSWNDKNSISYNIFIYVIQALFLYGLASIFKCWLSNDNPYLIIQFFVSCLIPGLLYVCFVYSNPFSRDSDISIIRPLLWACIVLTICAFTTNLGKVFPLLQPLDVCVAILAGCKFMKNAGNVKNEYVPSPAPTNVNRTQEQPVQQTNNVATAGATTGNITYKAVKAKYTFNDVRGMVELKAKLRGIGDELLNNKVGGNTARNGILLHGEPGNGKSFIGEAFAGELNLPVIYADFSDMVSKWVDASTEQINLVFNDAIKQAPCCLIFNEIDNLLPDRSKVANADSESSRRTNTMLTLLEKVRQHKVLVIGTTNNLDQLDSAGKREGRFDWKVEIFTPDSSARKEFLIDAFGNAISEESVEYGARHWSGFSVSRIRAIIRELQSSVKGNEITIADLKSALRNVQGSLGYKFEGVSNIDSLDINDTTKSRLNELVERFRSSEEYELNGGSLPSGIIFSGPAGTGKTVVARALAHAAGWAFVPTTGPDLMVDGEIDAVVRKASDSRPCVVFIDEADNICANREGASPYYTKYTNKLLTAIEGVEGAIADVIWVVATNHPETMDPAILRRLQIKIPFGSLGSSELVRFVEKWKASLKLTCDLSNDEIASLLSGHTISVADVVLGESVNNAITRWRNGRVGSLAAISRADIETALITHLGG